MDRRVTHTGVPYSTHPYNGSRERNFFSHFHERHTWWNPPPPPVHTESLQICACPLFFISTCILLSQPLEQASCALSAQAPHGGHNASRLVAGHRGNARTLHQLRGIVIILVEAVPREAVCRLMMLSCITQKWPPSRWPQATSSWSCWELHANNAPRCERVCVSGRQQCSIG